MKKYMYFALIPLIFLFNSCDPVGDAGFYVVNEASGEVYLYANDTLVVDSVVSGGKKMVFCDCGMGGGQIPSGRFYKGSVNVGISKVGNGSTICKKDITLESNWELVRLSKDEHEYTFTVKDKDF